MSPAPAVAWTVVILLVVLGLALVGRSVGRTMAEPAEARRGRRSAAVPLTMTALAAVVVSTLLSLPEPPLREPPDPEWSGDVRTGDLSQWSAVHAARPDAVEVVDAPVRDGYDHAIRFTVRPGDFTFGSETEERAEVVARSDLTEAEEGREQWYAWSMLLEEEPEVPAGGFLMLTQWHQDSDSCPPNAALLVVPGDDGPRLRLGVRGGELGVEDDCEPGYQESFDLGPLEIGAWQDLRLRVVWSADPARGRFEVYRDGERVLGPVPVANLYDGQGAYLKQGVYRSVSDQELTLYLAGTVRGATAASAQLAGCTSAAAPDESVMPWELLSRDRAWC